LTIEYKHERAISAGEFADLLNRCSLGARRPVNDPECLQGMIENSNLMITAWEGDVLIGISRSVTDFHFACYLSDLAVDDQYQKQGIGKQLMALTQQRLGPKCALILISAPAANEYYPHVGLTHYARCWVLEPGSKLQV
jgi:ribosomal protein S18 acetylase RimI-like enzyme